MFRGAVGLDSYRALFFAFAGEFAIFARNVNTTHMIMRAITTLLLCLVTSLSLSATIITKKDGKLLLVEFHAESIAAVDTETIVKDFNDAFDMAVQKKCNSIVFKERNGEFYMIVSGAEEVMSRDKYLAKLNEDFDKLTADEFIRGEVVSSEKKMVRKAQYRIETYENNKLVSVYESDWDHGYFPPETSTYKSASGPNITKKTMYVEPKYDTVETYAEGTTIRTEGYEVLARRLYIIE